MARRIRRAMFQKLRTSRYVKASGRYDAAVLEFSGKVRRIARVHQYGLKDRPNPNSHVVQYELRPLLGFNEDSKQLVENVILAMLMKNSFY
ncbi:UNVERIFIED_ORG: phage virion morphogenesis protein [Enterobacter sp. JUb101]|nr:phage virion morphogenesis protein [Lelliottia amnigena]